MGLTRGVTKDKNNKGMGRIAEQQHPEKKQKQVSSPELSTDQTGWVNKVITGSSSNGWLNYQTNTPERASQWAILLKRPDTTAHYALKHREVVILTATGYAMFMDNHRRPAIS